LNNEAVENKDLKEKVSMLENKSSEAGFREQLELYQLKFKDE